jgi:hypothetical protein
MNPRQEEVEGLAKAIDRLVFHESSRSIAELSPASLSVISYLNDSFPRITLPAGRRHRIQRRLSRALHIAPAEPAGNLARIEAEMNRRLANVDPRWRPFVGGAALVLLGVVGVAVWRQRGGIKPAIVPVR